MDGWQMGMEKGLVGEQARTRLRENGQELKNTK